MQLSFGWNLNLLVYYLYYLQCCSYKLFLSPNTLLNEEVGLNFNASDLKLEDA